MFVVLVLLLNRTAPTAVVSGAKADPDVVAILNPDHSIRWQNPTAAAGDIASSSVGSLRAGEQVVVFRQHDPNANDLSIVASTASQVTPARSSSVQGSPSNWLVAAVVPTSVFGGAQPSRIGVANGPWETSGAVELVGGIMGKRTGQGFVRMVRPDELNTGSKGYPLVTVDTAMPMDTARYAYRVQVIGKGGNSYRLSSSTPLTATGDQSLTFRGTFDLACRVVLQQRPYKWLSLPGRY